MTNPGSTPQVEHLLGEGIKAARAGDKAAARTLLEQVVELDDQNEKGWFWLAAVVESAEEKRICLGNVIIINPNNERARRLLEQLEERQSGGPAVPPDTIGGVSRRAVYWAIGLGATAIVALLVVMILLLSGGNEQKTATPVVIASPTSLAALPALEESPTADATLLAALPTPIPTKTPVPTWTPSPPPTAANTSPATPLAAPPASLSGTIIMRSGQVIGDEDNQPIVIIAPDGSNPRAVSPPNERGHSPVLSPDGQRFAYIRLVKGTREEILQHARLDGTGTEWFWGGSILSQQDAPAWSPDGAWIAFVAIGFGAQTPDLYRVSTVIVADELPTLERLTDDAALENWPAFSPDSQFIVYTADLTPTGEVGTELRIFNLTTKESTNLTTNGAELTEAAPDWSPDGRYIVFQAQAADESAPDIYRMLADGSAPPEKIIASDAADIQPRFSPDGRYIVFSSDRTGNWDVFIYDLQTQNVYQVTTNPQTDIANDWGS